MTTLRCTAKLLKRLRIDKPGEPPAPQNGLGDWLANIIYTRQGHYVILVSERSLLPVITTARDLDNLVPRFLRDLTEVLSALGVSERLIEREIESMEPMYFGRTNSRVVLGSMNDYVQIFRWCLPTEPNWTLHEWSIHLSQTPYSPLRGKRPKDVARQLLGNPHMFKVIEGGKF